MNYANKIGAILQTECGASEDWTTADRAIQDLAMQADAEIAALSPPESTEDAVEKLFEGLDDRLDRLLVNDTDSSRFILSGVSAHNITEIAKEWVRSRLRALPLQEDADDDDHMVKISKLIEDMQEVHRKFGDTCVYIRRGGLSWGAVALNRRDDDKKHGVFDLQAQHDRDMLARLEQIGRLKQSRDEWMEKALARPMVAEERGTK